jgi:hypothetical protein
VITEVLIVFTHTKKVKIVSFIKARIRIWNWIRIRSQMSRSRSDFQKCSDPDLEPVSDPDPDLNKFSELFSQNFFDENVLQKVSSLPKKLNNSDCWSFNGFHTYQKKLR